MRKEKPIKSINMQEHLDNLPTAMREAVVNAAFKYIQTKLAMNARVGAIGQPASDKSYNELLKERRKALDDYFVAEKEASAYLIARGFV